MRTYTRKRPEIKLIDDVHELCRLCLGKSNDVMTIYNDNTDFCALALRIRMCVGLEITNEECLPNIICTECFKEIEKYYAFRKKCEMSYQKLKSHLLAFKEITSKLNTSLEESTQETNQAKSRATASSEVQAKLHNSENTDQEKQQSIQNSTDQNFSLYLSAMLLKLGVLAQRDGDLAIVDNSLTTIHLETGDGSEVTLELVEEEQDESDNIIQKPPPVTNGDIDNQDAYIKFVTNTPSCNDNKPKRDDNSKNGEIRCERCDKRFLWWSTLWRHERLHDGVRPFACRHCHRTFSTRHLMKRHELVHAERRPYPCPHCNKSYTQRGSREAHLRTHHTRTPSVMLHCCGRCPKVFAHASGLSRHMMMTHKGRVFMCAICNKLFRDKSALQRHLKIHDRTNKISEPTVIAK